MSAPGQPTRSTAPPLARDHDYRHPAPVRALLASLVPIVCPPEAAALGLVDAVVEHVELGMGALERPVRLALLAGLAAYELGALPFGRRRASRLPAARAARYFAAWWSSPIGLQRELAHGVKGLLCLAHYELPEVQARLGYAPQRWIEEVDRRRLAVYGDDVRRAAAAVLEPDPLVVTPVDRPLAARGRR